MNLILTHMFFKTVSRLLTNLSNLTLSMLCSPPQAQLSLSIFAHLFHSYFTLNVL